MGSGLLGDPCPVHPVNMLMWSAHNAGNGITNADPSCLPDRSAFVSGRQKMSPKAAALPGGLI